MKHYHRYTTIMKKLAPAIAVLAVCLSADATAQLSTQTLLLEEFGAASPKTVTLRAPSTGILANSYTLVYPNQTNLANGSMLYVGSTTGSEYGLSWLTPGTNGQVLRMVGGLPVWSTVGLLPTGTVTNATLVWDGTNWVQNSNVTMNPTNGNTTINGVLTVNGSGVNLPSGSVDNSELANSTITVTPGTGLSGGGTVALGGSVTLNNTGLLQATSGNGINVSTVGGNATITNTGVTAIAGTPNRVTVSGSTGSVTVSAPQDIHTGASPTFAGMTLSALANSSTANNVVVSNNGVLETRTVASLGGGTSSEPFITFNAGSSSLTNNRVIQAGTGIDIADAGVDNGSITIKNIGLLGAAAGNGINVTTTNGVATIANTGITNVSGGTGINAVNTNGAVTLTNTGVTSLTGTANQVNVSAANGAVTLSAPQNIHTGATPTFAGMTLSALSGSSSATEIIVSNNGVLETRSVNSLPGFSGVTTNATLTGAGTVASPLGINLANANTWTATQTFSGNVVANGSTTLGDGVGSDVITVNATGGTFKLTGLTQDNTQSTVLVMDGTGVVRTRTAASLAGTAGWSLTGNSGTTPASNFLGTTDAQPLVIKTNNAERMRILSGGNVGIGSTNPGQKLEVQDGNILLSNSGTASEMRFAEPSASGSDYTAFKAQAQPSSVTYILPDTNGIVGDVLRVKSVTGGVATLDWVGTNDTSTAGALLFARKTADQTSSSTSLINDSHLSIPLSANKAYEISGALYVKRSNGNGSIDVAWDIPSGATMLISFFANESKSGNSNTGADIRDQDAVGSTNGTGYISIGINTNWNVIHFKGLVVMGNTAGNVVQQWCNAGGGTATVYTNSYMSAKSAQ